MDRRKKSCFARHTQSNTPPELITRKTTVERPQNTKFFLPKDETSPRLEWKYAVKTDVDHAQINNLQHFISFHNLQHSRFIQDQTQTEIITPITIESVQIQTLEIDTIQTTVPEILRITETGTTQSIGIDNTQIIDHETIQTTDQFIIIITIDHVTNPRTEILIFQIDKEIFRSHHTGKIHNIKIHNEAIEVVHSNIKDKSTRYNQLKKLNQTLPILITQKFRITIKNI